MLYQLRGPLTLGPRQVSGQGLEDAPVSVGSLHHPQDSQSFSAELSKHVPSI